MKRVLVVLIMLFSSASFSFARDLTELNKENQGNDVTVDGESGMPIRTDQMFFQGRTVTSTTSSSAQTRIPAGFRNMTTVDTMERPGSQPVPSEKSKNIQLMVTFVIPAHSASFSNGVLQAI